MLSINHIKNRNRFSGSFYLLCVHLCLLRWVVCDSCHLSFYQLYVQSLGWTLLAPQTCCSYLLILSCCFLSLCGSFTFGMVVDTNLAVSFVIQLYKNCYSLGQFLILVAIQHADDYLHSGNQMCSYRLFGSCHLHMVVSHLDLHAEFDF